MRLRHPRVRPPTTARTWWTRSVRLSTIHLVRSLLPLLQVVVDVEVSLAVVSDATHPCCWRKAPPCASQPSPRPHQHRSLPSPSLPLPYSLPFYPITLPYSPSILSYYYSVPFYPLLLLLCPFLSSPTTLILLSPTLLLLSPTPLSYYSLLLLSPTALSYYPPTALLLLSPTLLLLSPTLLLLSPTLLLLSPTLSPVILSYYFLLVRPVPGPGSQGHSSRALPSAAPPS